MSGSLVLDLRWPDDLDPVMVPFATRTVTVLRRRGFFDDPGLFDTLTVSEVAAWWDTGPVTIADLRTTAHAAIRRHDRETDLRERLAVALEAVAGERWAPQVWCHDPRFTPLLPRGSATVSDIAMFGSSLDRRYLFDRLEGLRSAIDAQAALSLQDAIAEYVGLVSGQYGERLKVLLARSGLGGHDRTRALVR